MIGSLSMSSGLFRPSRSRPYAPVAVTVPVRRQPKTQQQRIACASIVPTIDEIYAMSTEFDRLKSQYEKVYNQYLKTEADRSIIKQNIKKNNRMFNFSRNKKQQDKRLNQQLGRLEQDLNRLSGQTAEKLSLMRQNNKKGSQLHNKITQYKKANGIQQVMCKPRT
jgi:chromosome segregation ATPase